MLLFWVFYRKTTGTFTLPSFKVEKKNIVKVWLDPLQSIRIAMVLNLEIKTVPYLPNWKLKNMKENILISLQDINMFL